MIFLCDFPLIFQVKYEFMWFFRIVERITIFDRKLEYHLMRIQFMRFFWNAFITKRDLNVLSLEQNKCTVRK